MSFFINFIQQEDRGGNKSCNILVAKYFLNLFCLSRLSLVPLTQQEAFPLRTKQQEAAHMRHISTKASGEKLDGR